MRDRAMRVLVVVTALMPDQLQVWKSASEIEGVDLHLAGSLVYDAADSYTGDLAVPAWATTHVLRAHDLVHRGRMWWRLGGLVELIRELQPDVVHVHSEVWGLLVSQALRGGVPTVAHGAENVSLDHGGRVEARIRKVVAKYNARRLAGYASWNRAGIGVVQGGGLPMNVPVAVAPAVVPDPAPYLEVDRPELPESPVRVGFLGRLVPEKGLQWLIAALAGVGDARLVVTGSGPYEQAAREQVATLGIDAEFGGAVEPARVPATLAGVHMLVVPSLEVPGWAEQFGRVVCEAMLVGVPVIASDSGSLREVVGDGGIVVPEADEAALHDAISKLIADPQARARLGEQGREWALAHLVPDAAARSLVDLWEKVAVPA